MNDTKFVYKLPFVTLANLCVEIEWRNLQAKKKNNNFITILVSNEHGLEMMRSKKKNWNVSDNFLSIWNASTPFNPINVLLLVIILNSWLKHRSLFWRIWFYLTVQIKLKVKGQKCSNTTKSTPASFYL